MIDTFLGLSPQFCKMLIRFAIPDFNSVICLSYDFSYTFQHIVIIISAYLLFTYPFLTIKQLYDIVFHSTSLSTLIPIRLHFPMLMLAFHQPELIFQLS